MAGAPKWWSNERDRSAQPWLRYSVARHDLRLRTHEGCLPDRVHDDWSNLMPGPSYFPTVRSCPGPGQATQRAIPKPRYLAILQSFKRFLITLLRKSQQMVKADCRFDRYLGACDDQGISPKLRRNSQFGDKLL